MSASVAAVGAVWAEPLEARRLLAAVLVEDFNSGGVSSAIREFTRLGEWVYFVAEDLSHGRELWRSDGTTAGTALVADIFPGVSSSAPADLVALGNFIYFAANDSAHGRELWRTDGSAGGTVMVKDIAAGSASSSPRELTLANGRLLFSASTVSQGAELWVSDGTGEGTSLLADIRHGSQGSFPGSLTVTDGGIVFFQADDGEYGNELWKTDGTATGTSLVADLTSPGTDANLFNLTALGEKLFFTFQTPQTGSELWVSDGTLAGTHIVRDIREGSQSSSVQAVTAFNGKLYFSADNGQTGRELWQSDGTWDGTLLIEDLNPGNVGSDPVPSVIGGQLYFVARFASVLDAIGLWTYSDETGQATRLMTLGDGVNRVFSSLGTSLLFIRSTSAGRQLVAADQGAQTPRLVKDLGHSGDINPPAEAAEIAGRLLFVFGYAAGAGAELWATDGSESGTLQVADIREGTTGSDPFVLGEMGGGQIVLVRPGAFTTALWWVGEGERRKLRDLSGGVSIAEGARAGNWFYVLTSDGLLRTDGTLAGTSIVSNTVFQGINPRQIIGLGEQILFGGYRGPSPRDYELWRSDGTSAGTVLLKSINSGNTSSSPRMMLRVGNTVYFVATTAAHGSELWKTDGTAEGTQLVADINVGAGDAFPSGGPPVFEQFLVAIGDIIYFSANDGVGGAELWKSDGTAAGTVRVKDIAPGSGHGSPGSFVVIEGRLFFTANDGESGREPWISDGTEAGTFRLKDIEMGTGWSIPSEYVKLGDAVYFHAMTSTGGRELWMTDGTHAGTQIVTDILTGSGSGVVHNPLMASIPTAFFTVIGDRLYFAGSDGIHGPELWVSDGTAEGTRMVQDLYVGTAGAAIRGLKRMGEALLMGASNGFFGQELWIVRPPNAVAGGTVAVAPGGLAELDASASSDPTPGELLTYEWDLDLDGVFGETGADARRGGEVGVQPGLATAGVSSGSFMVPVKVRNSAGLSSMSWQRVNVGARPSWLNPVADAQYLVYAESDRITLDVREGDLSLSSVSAIFLDDLTIAPAAMLELGGVAVIIRHATLTHAATISSWIESGRINSTLDDLNRGIAVVMNDAGGGRLLKTHWNGASLGADDLIIVLAKHGDANLDGVVTIADYLRVDRASPRGATGWANGDFDRSGGPADGADYFLMDQAYLEAVSVPAANVAFGPIATPFAIASLFDDEPEETVEDVRVW